MAPKTLATITDEELDKYYTLTENPDGFEYYVMDVPTQGWPTTFWASQRENATSHTRQATAGASSWAATSVQSASGQSASQGVEAAQGAANNQTSEYLLEYINDRVLLKNYTEGKHEGRSYWTVNRDKKGKKTDERLPDQFWAFTRDASRAGYLFGMGKDMPHVHCDPIYSYEEYAHSQVYACAVGIHSIADTRGGTVHSANHVTLYLLVGEDSCVRVDMTPEDDINTGGLYISGRTYSKSNTVLTQKAFPAYNQPANFVPTKTKGQQAQPNVYSFIRALLTHGLQYFRFLSINDRGMGCQSWVRTALYVLSNENCIQQWADNELDSWLLNQYDKKKEPYRIPYTPGIFRSAESAATGYDSQAIRTKLAEASNDELQCLCTAAQFNEKHETLLQRSSAYMKARQNGEALDSLVSAIQGFPTSVAIASDLAQTNADTLRVLQSAFVNRYRFSHHTLGAILHQQSWNPEFFVLALAVVLEIEGPEDL